VETGDLIVRIGIGLPPNPDGLALVDLARRAEAGPFSTVGLLDRLVYPNPEPLIVLAGIAAATSRIRVQTEVLLAPLRDTTTLAKQAATLDRLSRGRFTLGLGVGGRTDDYVAAGIDYRRRGRRMDEQMALLRRIWSGEPPVDDVRPIGPPPWTPGGPEVLFGAFLPAALDRVAAWGDGLLAAGPATITGRLFDAVRAGWQAAGRSGRPRLVGQVNVALEPLTEESRAALIDYYGPNEPYTPQVLQGLVTEPAALRATIQAFAELGADELMLYTWTSDVRHVDLLTEAVAGLADI
jgi:alkanesulfonate monooxygenase SsuD/methylene tetrahydromethanopterin reductase-like flavin-dependent oxidoreductase (luciferase family)